MLRQVLTILAVVLAAGVGAALFMEAIFPGGGQQDPPPRPRRNDVDAQGHPYNRPWPTPPRQKGR